MQAVAVRARALLRSNVGATLALLVLAGLAAGFALGAWGAARRGGGAFDRFLDHARQAELSVFVCAPDPAMQAPCTGDDELARLKALPVVEAAARTAAVPVRYEIPGVGNLDAAIEVIIDGEFPTPDGTPIVVEGRLLDPAAADEVVLPEGSDAGLTAGTVFAVTPLRLGEAGPATPISELRHELLAVGKVRQPSSLAARIGELEQEPEAPAVGPGWWQRYGALVSYYGIVIQVRSVPGTDPEVLRAEVAAAMGESFHGSEPAIGDEQLSVASAIRYEASALGLFAAAVAVAALVFVGQALARQASREASDTETLRAIGMSRGQLVGAAALRALPVALGAATVAALGAWLSSAFTPIGLAARAEVAVGLRVDLTVLVLGWLAVAGGVTTCLVLPALVATRRRRAARQRARGLGVVAAEAGLPVTAVAGAGILLPADRQTNLPLRAAAVGLALAVGATVTAVAAVASFDHLIATPANYGVTWDVEVDNAVADDQADAARTLLEGSPEVVGMAERRWIDGRAGGEFLQLVAFDHLKGDTTRPWPVVEGQEPQRPGDIALGTKAMERLGVGIGDVVEVEVPGTTPGPYPLRVVGRSVVNVGGGRAGDGAIVPMGWFRDVVVPYNLTAEMMVRMAPGTDLARLEESLGPIGMTVTTPVRQPDIRNLQRLDRLPWLLVAVVIVLAGAALVHALYVVGRRHRGPLAVMRAIGFTRGQVRRSLLWAATFLTLAALAVGVPLGIVVGRWGWRWLATDAGVLSAPVVPWPAIVAVAVLAVVIVNLLTLVPSRAASRVRPAEALRCE